MEQLAAALPEGGRTARARLEAALDPTRHPHLVAALGDLSAPHPIDHFDHALGLVVTGVRARLGT